MFIQKLQIVLKIIMTTVSLSTLANPEGVDRVHFHHPLKTKLKWK